MLPDPEYKVLNINFQMQTNISIHIFCKVKNKQTKKKQPSFFNPHPRTFFHWFLERGGEIGKDWKREDIFPLKE